MVSLEDYLPQTLGREDIFQAVQVCFLLFNQMISLTDTVIHFILARESDQYVILYSKQKHLPYLPQCSS